MPYSEVVDGKVLDYRFKKRDVDTVFYIGDIWIGQLFRIYGTWTAVSRYPTDVGAIGGFKTRILAAEYLLKVFRIKK